MKQKLKAFTLMELLIGMIVSSIVIGFGFSSYAIITKQYRSYKAVKTKIVECMQLNTMMINDIEKAEAMLMNGNQLELESTDETLYYHFLDSLIVRNVGEVADTFKLAPFNFQTNTDENKKTLICRLLFDVSIFDKQQHFTFTKSYAAETLLNYGIE